MNDKLPSVFGYSRSHRRAQSEMAISNTNAKDRHSDFPIQTKHSFDCFVHRPLERRQRAGPDEMGEIPKYHQSEDIFRRIPTSLCDPSRLDHRLVFASRMEPSTNRAFIPRGDLTKIVTQASVNHELSSIRDLPSRVMHRARRSATHIRIQTESAREDAELVETMPIRSPAAHARHHQVYAILLLIGRPKKLRRFWREGVSDADLPLIIVRQDTGFELRRSRDASTALRLFRNQVHTFKFAQQQWSVLAPLIGDKFIDKAQHLRVSEEQIMPFTSWQRASRRGGSGEV